MMLTGRGTELRTAEEARMGLSSYKVGAGPAVSDTVRKFYEGKLGLSMGADNLRYRYAERIAVRR
jgi:hypothetical protein